MLDISQESSVPTWESLPGALLLITALPPWRSWGRAETGPGRGRMGRKGSGSDGPREKGAMALSPLPGELESLQIKLSRKMKVSTNSSAFESYYQLPLVVWPRRLLGNWSPRRSWTLSRVMCWVSGKQSLGQGPGIPSVLWLPSWEGRC